MLDGLPSLPTLPGLVAGSDRTPGLPGAAGGDGDAAGGFAAQLARSSQDLSTAPAGLRPASPAAAASAQRPAARPVAASARPAAAASQDTSPAAPGGPGAAPAAGAPAAPKDGVPASRTDDASAADGAVSAGPVLETLAAPDGPPGPSTTAAAPRSSDEGTDGPALPPDPASLAAWVAAWAPPTTQPPAATTSAPDGPAPLTGAVPASAGLSGQPVARGTAPSPLGLPAAADSAPTSAAPAEPAVDDETDSATAVAPDTGSPPAAAAANTTTVTATDTAPAAPSEPPLAAMAQAAAVALPPPPAPTRPEASQRPEPATATPAKGAVAIAGTDERSGPRTLRGAATSITASPAPTDLAAGADRDATRTAAAEAPPDTFAQRLDTAIQATSATPTTPVPPAAGARTDVPALAIATPAMAPEFREALGVQVSVLARDGVQQAELHLNPSEMGPISVRIEIDGSQAQVNFGVDHAGTRAIVEAGLPELASALREAGLTLTGGGVSDHARGPGSDAAAGGSRQDGAREDRPEGRRGGAGRGDPPDAAPPAPRRVRLPGGVDLYA